MKKINLFLFYFLQLTWGIIQNIVGFLIYIALMIKDPNRPRLRFNGAFVILWDSNYSASIGMFIFVGRVEFNYFARVVSHEYGHCIQSCILGPFYFLVIGLPSYIWAHNKRFIRNRYKGNYLYSDFYCEKWANRLGKKYTGLEPINH